MSDLSKGDRAEIHDGWVAFATHVIERGFKLAEISRSFTWKPEVQFILHEVRGMSGLVVQTVTKSFSWPHAP
jgi:hypothetical protein